MGRALRPCVIDVRHLAGALDLWLCMWEPEEQERYETAVVRAMTDANPRATRMQALALCFAIGTPRLLDAAQRVAETRVVRDGDAPAVEIAGSPLREVLDA